MELLAYSGLAGERVRYTRERPPKRVVPGFEGTEFAYEFRSHFLVSTSTLWDDGDINANEVPKLLVLKTTVEKYTPGSETRRAVTTVSDITKLTVRSQLITREPKVALDRTVNGEVRFFGSNMRATHNLARNIVTAIKQSSWIETDQPAVAVTGQP